MSREEVAAQYVAKYGMGPEQVWRRACVEMAFIRQEGREPELLGGGTFEDIHTLAERILDEHVAERERRHWEQWGAR